MCDDPEQWMDCFSFRCTNPGCCWGLASYFPDLTVQMNPLITYTHAQDCRTPMWVGPCDCQSVSDMSKVTSVRLLDPAVQVKGFYCTQEGSLAPGATLNLHAPAIWMTQENQGRSTTCVSLIAGTPSCCHGAAVCTAVCASILSYFISNTWSTALWQ